MWIRALATVALLATTPIRAELLTPGDLREDRAPGLEQLFLDLRSDEREVWRLAETALINRFSRSGSPAMDLLLQRGHAMLEADDLRGAIWHLSTLIDHAPNFAEAYNTRATAYYRMGEYGLALQDVRATLVLNPRHFIAMGGLGIILAELGHTDQALSAFRAAQIVHPNMESLIENIEQMEQARGMSL
ncbi:MAG: tetratricopeptide repeat protein [Paracoccaceae bacterium]